MFIVQRQTENHSLGSDSSRIFESEYNLSLNMKKQNPCIRVRTIHMGKKIHENSWASSRDFLAKPEYPNGLIIELCTLIIISKTEGFSPQTLIIISKTEGFSPQS